MFCDVAFEDEEAVNLVVVFVVFAVVVPCWDAPEAATVRFRFAFSFAALRGTASTCPR